MRLGPPRLRKLLEQLVAQDVRFVLVGGLAVGAWGHVRGTKDIDIVPDPERENLSRLLDALADRLRDRDDLERLREARGESR